MSDERQEFCTLCGSKLEANSTSCQRCGKSTEATTKAKKKHKVFLIISTALLCVMVLIVGVYASGLITHPATSPEWKPMASIDGKFSVSMPGDPVRDDSVEKISDTIEIPLTLYTVSLGAKDAYMAGYAVYSDPKIDVSNPKAILEGTVNGAGNSIKGTLSSTNYTTVNGHPAVDYIQQASIGEVHGRNILVDRHLYMLLYINTPFNPADYSRFVESFKLTGK